MNTVKTILLLFLFSTTIWAEFFPFPSLTTSVGPGFSDEGVNFHFDSELAILLTGQDFGAGPLVGFHYNSSDTLQQKQLALGGSTLFIVNNAFMMNVGGSLLINSEHAESPGYRVFAAITPESLIGFELAYSHYVRNELQLLVTFDIAMKVFDVIFEYKL